jgi:hypothetical protein
MSQKLRRDLTSKATRWFIIMATFLLPIFFLLCVEDSRGHTRKMAGVRQIWVCI